MSPMKLLPLLLLLTGSAQAQVLTFDGDGFETCPRGAMALTSLNSWNGVFGTFPTPVPSAVMSVRRQMSLGLLLTAPTTSAGGEFQVKVQQNTVGEALLSLSRCDSVYPPSPANCVSAVSRTPTLEWTTDPAGRGCLLESGVSYFFNVTMGSQTEPGDGQPWCSTWLSRLQCDLTMTTTLH